MPPAVAASVKASGSRDELPDQNRKSDPENRCPGESRRQLGNVRAHAPYNKRNPDRQRALNEDQS